MVLAQVREKIEEVFPKYKHHWFDLMEDGATDTASENFLIGLASQEVFQLLEISAALKTESAKLDFIKSAIGEIQGQLKAERDEYSKGLETASKEHQSTTAKIWARDAEKILGFSIARFQVKIDFLEWFLSEKIENIKEVKEPNESSELPTIVASNDEQTLSTEPPKQIPLSSLTYRQLALWCHYWQKAGEMERFDKQAAFDFAKRHEKDGQNFYQKYWLTASQTVEKVSSRNLNDHETILPHLKSSFKAHRLAQDAFDFLKQKISM